MTKNDQPLRHIGLFRMHEDASEEAYQKAAAMLRELKNTTPGMLEWHIALSLDTRKGRITVQNSLFENSEALQAYRISEEHKVVVSYLSQIADWGVGDYDE